MNKSFTFNPYTALKSILEVTSLHTGKDFIKVTAKEIKKLFQADLVLISNALDYEPTSKIKIIYSTDSSIPKECELKDAPCEIVYKDKKILKVNEKVKDIFAQEANTDFQSYYGVPIISENNKCIGHIAIFSKQIRDLPNELEDIATIYARKIERETKRLQLEQENEQIRKQLEELSITDGLTGLYNRRYFSRVCEDIYAQVLRGTTTASLAYIDLDNFKSINDKFGHDGGDDVLRKFAKILKNESRHGVDHIFRLGGEEFCIISINTSLHFSYGHLARIMSATSNNFQDTKYGEITLSVGIVEFDKNFKNYNEIITLADKKMYRAKKAGKNAIVK